MAKLERPLRPGLAKVRTPPILQRRRAELVSMLGGRFLELLEAASVMSEGQACRDDEGGLAYYGMTSLLFIVSSAGGLVPDAAAADLALALQHDPHARLQILRIAHREAWARATAPLGPLHAEVSIQVIPRGVMVTVDVVANLLARRARPVVS